MDWGKISAIAAIAAAIFTFFAPLLALQISARLAQRQARNQRKFEVFQTLMRWRAHMYAEQPVQALNLIDVLFHDVREVRDAWEEVYASFNDSRLNTPEGGRARLDKIHKLLRVMADHLGYGKQFSSADFERVYNPEFLGRYYQNQIAETNQRFEQANGKQSPPSVTSPTAATAGKS